MTDDLFANLQSSTMQEALKASDPAPATRARVKKEAEEVTPSSVPEPRVERHLLVIDPTKLDTTSGELTVAGNGQIIVGEDAVIGRIPIPEEFCGLDSTGCTHASDTRHMFSFTKEHGWWVHMNCGQPTRKWFVGAVKDLVEVDDEELSWLHDRNTGHERGSGK